MPVRYLYARAVLTLDGDYHVSDTLLDGGDSAPADHFRFPHVRFGSGPDERQRLFRSVPIASQTYDFLTQDDNAGYYDDADDDVLEHALIYAPHEHCS